MENVYDIGDSIVLTGIFLSSETVGSIDVDAKALSVGDATGYTTADTVLVVGAGHEGGNLVTTVVSVSGTTVTLTDAASTRVVAADVGKLTNPTTVNCYVTVGSTSYAPTVTPVTTGIFSATYEPTVSGQGWYRFVGTGAVKGAGEQSFRVRPQRATAPV